MCSGPTQSPQDAFKGSDPVANDMAMERLSAGNPFLANLLGVKKLMKANDKQIAASPTAASPTFGLRVKSPAVGAADLRVPVPGGDA